MTDTRKEFEEWFLAQYGIYYKYAEFQFDHAPETKLAWQACQSLNDKHIEQLLAVLAKKNEALQACSDAMEYMSEYDIPLTLAEDTDKALALQPADVELVEIGEARIIDINGTGTFVWKKGNMPALAENPKLYTIKKKGK